LTNILNKQYLGFLNTPQLFNDEKTLGVKPFKTDEKVDISSIEKYAEAISKHKYLGKRAELFFLAYLEASTRYTDIIHSFQINTEEKTIGELDFICFDQLQQKWIHIELVYKLYVFKGENQFDDFSQWIGPNLKDRLDHKVNKLITHQLPLGQHPDIRNKIETNTIESYCCFKARLFLENRKQSVDTLNLNSDCITGNYLNFEEFKSYKHQKSLFCVPEKINWICKADSNRHWYDFKEAENKLKPMLKEKRAQLVWIKTEEGDYLEYFIVWW
jgi:hypothetical protein